MADKSSNRWVGKSVVCAKKFVHDEVGTSDRDDLPWGSMATMFLMPCFPGGFPGPLVAIMNHLSRGVLVVVTQLGWTYHQG